MSDQHDSPEDATPVPPPPADVVPSATGLVDGDPDELREVPETP